MKDFEKNRRESKQVCLLAIVVLTVFIRSLILSYLITFQKRFTAAHNGEKKKQKKHKEAGKGRKESKRRA